ncbi:MAG: helix-turn-helix domain-containing protein [Alphaproteobacteria bacterium]|nr:helix-turn-helix domain-containing protein [Alphaproteobacteria bacterium]
MTNDSDTRSDPDPAHWCREAVRLAGGPTKVARLYPTPISQAAVSQWREVPVARVPLLAQASGVPDWRLRPDVFPMPNSVAEKGGN